MASCEQLESRIAGKFGSFKAAVQTEKGFVETEHAIRNSRFNTFVPHDAPTEEKSVNGFGAQEQRALLAKSKILTAADFVALKVLGEGSFGIVYLAKRKGGDELFALKQMKKAGYVRKNHRERVFAERDILAEAESRWLVDLYATFHDAENAYMVMEFLQGGDLIGHLLKRKRFTQQETSFYMAELIEALNVVHSCGFIHRDVKPDNVVLTTQGHLKLLDFGLCRQDVQEGEANAVTDGSRRAQLRSMVGTPQYMAPEVFNADYGIEADIWSVGVITYECLVGIVPFHGGQYQGRDAIKLIRKKVSDHATVLPEQIAKARSRGYVGQTAENFIRRVLCSRDCRINAAECSRDPFFAGLDFKHIHLMQPPIVPSVASAADTKHFDNFKFKPLAAASPDAKDVSMEWVHYDFDRDSKILLRKASSDEVQQSSREEQRHMQQLQREISLQAGAAPLEGFLSAVAPVQSAATPSAPQPIVTPMLLQSGPPQACVEVSLKHLPYAQQQTQPPWMLQPGQTVVQSQQQCAARQIHVGSVMPVNFAAPTKGAR